MKTLRQKIDQNLCRFSFQFLHVFLTFLFILGQKSKINTKRKKRCFFHSAPRNRGVVHYGPPCILKNFLKKKIHKSAVFLKKLKEYIFVHFEIVDVVVGRILLLDKDAKKVLKTIDSFTVPSK